MISRKEIKYIKDLSHKRNRFAEGKFVVEGEKLVAELLQSRLKIDSLYATEAWAGARNVSSTLISEKDLKRISQLKSPNKVLAVVQIPEYWDIDTGYRGITLFLDRVNDPGNLGTIIRTADWFGIKHILCSENTVDVFNGKVIQSSMGSVFRVAVEYVNGVEFLTNFKNDFPDIPVLGASMEGEDIGGGVYPKTALLILGSESHGISDELEQFIERKVTIPRYGSAESLNVAAATAILLWEWRRCAKMRQCE